MLQNVRRRLKKFAFLHNIYMRFKRVYTGELLGMTTKSEQEYIAAYGEKLYTGEGEIVDLGCWLGSTTISLASGLKKNPAFTGSKRKIFAYDTFTWYESMNEPVAGTDLVGKFAAGDSFLETYKQRTSEHASHIEIRAGDLTTIGWRGGDIEFLLVDAMKSWELANSIVRDFYPHLIPGKSLVLQQDFAHYFTVWIHLIHWKLRDYFAFEADVPYSSSVVFRNTKTIPVDLLNKKYSFSDFSDQDVKDAIKYSLSFTCADKRTNILAAGVMAHIHNQRYANAQNALKEIAADGAKFEGDLLIVQELIHTANS